MTQYHNKTFARLIFLILTQVFLLTGVACHGFASDINYREALRVPMMTAGDSGRFQAAGLDARVFNLSDSGLKIIEQEFPVFGGHIRRAVDFFNSRKLQDGKPFLEGISAIRIIQGQDITSAGQSGSEFVIKLGDTSFLSPGFEQEIFLYFLYMLAGARGTFGDELQPQNQQADNILISKEGELEHVILKDKDRTFMLIANFKKDGNKDKIRQHIGLFSDTAQEFNVNSTVIQDGVCTEARSRRFRMPFDNRLWVGVPPGCEIFKFTPQENPVFNMKNIQEILGVQSDLKEVLSFFVAAGVFEEKKNIDIHRITILNGMDEKISAYITTTDARELIINIPLNSNLNPAEAMEAIALALKKADIIHQITKVRQKMDISVELADSISKAQENIDKTREPVLSAIESSWKRKEHVYKEMTKERPSDARILAWVKEHARYLKDKVIVSRQMEMGFHPELSLSLMGVLREEVDKGNMAIEEADDLFKKIEMSSMAGGLGALMPDWLRGLADNGANVVSFNIVYKTYEHSEITGEWLKEAIRRLPGSQTVKGLKVKLKDGSTRNIDLNICLLGKVVEIWIEELKEKDKIYITEQLYENHQESPERVAQMDFYNAAVKAGFKWLRENKVSINEIVMRSDNAAELLNEVYTYFPENKSKVVIPVNHTVVEMGVPFFPAGNLEGIIDKDTLAKITDQNGRAHLAIFGLMEADAVLGVSKDHTKILTKLFIAWINRVVSAAGFTHDEKSKLLRKIVRDEEYNSSNGAHPKHFQAPEIQDLIEKYKENLGDAAMDYDKFRLEIQRRKNAQLKQKFMEELDDIVFGLTSHLITLLQSQGQALGWKPDKTIPIGGIIRRIVDYKELVRFVLILENDALRERFIKSGVRIVPGGRFNPGMLNHIKNLTERYGLQNQIAVFSDYNIGDAPIILQGENFTVMLSRKGEEAASTSPQKESLNGGPVTGVRDGILHESEGFLEEFDPETLEGNGFVVKYGEDGRPLTESLLECFEKISNVYKDAIQRQNIQFNSLMKGLEFNEVTHQARGTLNIINEIFEEKEIKSLKNKIIDNTKTSADSI